MGRWFGCWAVMLAILLLAMSAPPRVFIDPGHGASSNSGMTTVLCEREADSNLRVARALAERLASGGIDVILSRTASVGPSYPDRIEAAAAGRAKVLISVHADARGEAEEWNGCPRNDREPGFAVLFSAEGPRAKAQRTLARRIAKAMIARGFLAYDGADYGMLYAKDEPGVFQDRRGLFMLRRPKMPSVIVETHHAWHHGEAMSWKKKDTLDAFAAAVKAALEGA